jgi:hypothetical protein
MKRKQNKPSPKVNSIYAVKENKWYPKSDRISYGFLGCVERSTQPIKLSANKIHSQPFFLLIGSKPTLV